MKLEYKVLWFEDQFEYVDDAISSIEQFVREKGFLPEIERRTGITGDEIDELAEKLDGYNPYDLIIFDYDLGGASEDGLHIAGKLRNTIFTDMIFYSGKVSGELRKLLYENRVDGVFVVHRDTFYDDIEPLIEDHIKRMSDINNIRGVVMSGTSALDLRLREVLVGRLEELDADKRDEVLGKIKEKLGEQVKNQTDRIEQINCPVEAVKDYRVTHFDLIRVLLKGHFQKGTVHYNSLNDGSVLHKVQVERNNLAHQRDEYTGDGKMVLHGRTGRVPYNFSEFQRLRNELLEAIASLEDM